MDAPQAQAAAAPREGASVAASSHDSTFRARLDQFECGICLGIVSDTRETVCCGKIYCSKCVWHQRTCPNCRAGDGVFTLQKSVAMDRLIKEQTGECPHCKCRFAPRELAKHLSECLEAPVPFTCKGCPLLVKRGRMPSHLEDRCIFTAQAVQQRQEIEGHLRRFYATGSFLVEDVDYKIAPSLITGAPAVHLSTSTSFGKLSRAWLDEELFRYVFFPEIAITRPSKPGFFPASGGADDETESRCFFRSFYRGGTSVREFEENTCVLVPERILVPLLACCEGPELQQVRSRPFYQGWQDILRKPDPAASSEDKLWRCFGDADGACAEGISEFWFSWPDRKFQVAIVSGDGRARPSPSGHSIVCSSRTTLVEVAEDIAKEVASEMDCPTKNWSFEWRMDLVPLDRHPAASLGSGADEPEPPLKKHKRSGADAGDRAQTPPSRILPPCNFRALYLQPGDDPDLQPDSDARIPLLDGEGRGGLLNRYWRVRLGDLLITPESHYVEVRREEQQRAGARVGNR